ncbi:MAG TPA: glycosyltransferase family A protein [Vicinamibacterales bacterium]|jgi:glycosyltransferase involved in cell wall biosynthesis|nr:glycosyltransferase family A protein [Vicinamibacterales bacterium]
MPRVTVIVATYNWATVLPYSIASVLGQTYADFELLVVGDGCRDESEDVVRAIPDSRVRWTNIARAGHQSGPHNEGLRQARGELIAYLGHDDLWLPHHLAQHVAALDAGGDVSHSLLALVPPAGSGRPVVISTPGPTPPPSAVVHRRTVTDSLGGWRDFRDLSVTPEYDLWRRAAHAGFHFSPVRRLTGLKFSAAARKGVYAARPCHEQAAWLARVEREPDLEAVLLAGIAIDQHRDPTSIERMWRLAVTPSRWRTFVFRGRGARLKREQRFKGVYS